MATYRNIQMTFWSDSKVLEEFETDDKLMFLYLMTNCRTSNCGCYEIPMTFMANETGFSKEKVKKLITRLQNELDVIRYDFDTKEVLILNWHKYNWTSSNDFQKSLRYAISQVRNPDFKAYLTGCLEGLETVPRPSIDGGGTTVTVTVTDNNTVTDSVTDIINHFNDVCGTNYKTDSKESTKLIKKVLKEFTVEDCFTVIDTMHEKWGNDPKMRDYLRPQTLFTEKFESYLNMPRGDPRNRDEIGDYLMGVIHGQGSA